MPARTWLTLGAAKQVRAGNIWVDASTYLLRRTEGEPAKTPSWWVRDIHIALLYGDAGGMWLQTSSEATANIRIFGRHTIISRDREYKISNSIAARSAFAPIKLLNHMP